MKSYSDNISESTKTIIDSAIADAEARVNDTIIANESAAKKRDLIIFIAALFGIAIGGISWFHWIVL